MGMLAIVYLASKDHKEKLGPKGVPKLTTFFSRLGSTGKTAKAPDSSLNCSAFSAPNPSIASPRSVKDDEIEIEITGHNLSPETIQMATEEDELARFSGNPSNGIVVDAEEGQMIFEESLSQIVWRGSLKLELDLFDAQIERICNEQFGMKGIPYQSRPKLLPPR